jgi:Zn-dependent metalloprotease
MLQRSNFSARLLALAVSLSAGAGSQFGCTEEDIITPTSDDAVSESSAALTLSGPKLVNGSDAEALLNPTRQSLLRDLTASSTSKPSVTLEANSKAVMGIGLSWQGGKPTRADDALKFVNLYQGLLDDKINVSEYQVGTSKLPCDNAVVTLDRVVDGIQVIGSRMTFHFDENARLVYVTNGVASVPSFRKDVDPSTLPGVSLLIKRLGQTKPENAKRDTVLVPMPDGTGLYKAELLSWINGGRVQGVVAVGDYAVSEIIDAQTQNEGRSSTVAPKFAAGERSDVPSQISYRSIGGLRISGVTGELNPLETAYRYLEEHPTVFHTGAARCQYTPRSITENPTIPGVYTARLSQRHGSVPVFGAELVIRMDGANTIVSVTSRTLGNINISTTPTVSAVQAINAALTLLNNGGLASPAWRNSVAEARAAIATAKLVILPRFMSRNLQVVEDRLAWQIDRGEFTIMIDAHNQQPLWSSSKRHAATIVNDARNDTELGYLAYTRVSLNGITQPGAPTPPNSDNATSRLGGNVATTLSRLQGMYARNGVNEANLIASTNVRLSIAACPNAYYDSFITNSAFFCLGEASADVVGHEMTHGVIAHTSGLYYADQSGAINEAYADLIGNLNDLSPGWLLGEQTVSGTKRNMLNPAAFGQPSHMSGYVARTGACGPWPWECDFGNVHTNSGILNRAHVLVTDGLVGRFPGIGRERMERLAFAVMTQLPASATLNQVSGVTRDVCDMFVARGVTTAPLGLTFTSAHCDVVTNAFNQVGLNPGLDSGWAEPTLGFAGTDTIHPPGADGSLPLTPGLCPITNIKLQHQVGFPIFPITVEGDYDPATALPPRTSILDWFATTRFVFSTPVTARPFPLDTPVRTHRVAWTSAYGVRPTYNTDIQSPATCNPPTMQNIPSAVTRAGFEVGSVTGSTSVAFGRVVEPLGAGCAFVNADLELLDGNGVRIAGPGTNLTHTITHWILFVPVNFNATASIARRPTAGDFTGVVNMNWDLGQTVRARWVYNFTTTETSPACLTPLPPGP